MMFPEEPEQALVSLTADRNIRPPEVEADPASFTEVVGAGFRVNNSVASLLTNRNFPSGDPDPHFELTTEKVIGYENYIPHLSQASNDEELEAIKAQIDREQEDRRILDEAGVPGVMVSLASGVLDPINLIPLGGVVYRGLKTGATLTQIGGRSAVLGGLSAGVAEVPLHLTQETRTATESVLNVAASAVVMGAIGTGLAALGKGAFKRAVNELANDVSPMDSKIAVGRKNLEADGVEIPEKMPPLPEAVMEPLGREIGGQSISAADRYGFSTSIAPSFGLLELAGKWHLSPKAVVLTRKSAMARKFSLLLGDTPYYFKDDSLGPTPPHAVETRIQARWDAPTARAKLDTVQAYREYRQRIASEKGDPLSAQQFREAIGKAMRRKDQSKIPEVAARAKGERELADDVWAEAVKVGLYKEGATQTTAPSWLHRVFNSAKIQAQPKKWQETTRDWARRVVQARINELEKRLGSKTAAPGTEDELQVLRSYDDGDFNAMSQEMAGIIGGLPQGRTLNTSIKLTLPRLRGATLERSFDIEDFEIEDFLIHDIDYVRSQYMKTMGPDIELARMFDGDPGAEAWLGVGGHIHSEYERLIDKGQVPPEEMNSTIKILQGELARVRHMHTLPQDHSSGDYRVAQAVKEFLLITRLPSVTLTSIPDMVGTVLHNGLMRSAGTAFKLLGAELSRNTKLLKAAKWEVQACGVGWETVLNNRSTSMFDAGGEFAAARATGIERGLEKASRKFGNISLLNQWTDVIKRFSGITTYDRLLRIAEKHLKGKKLFNSEIMFARYMNLTDQDLTNIGRHFVEFGDKDGGLYIPRTDLWKDPEGVLAALTLRNGVAKLADAAVVTPHAGDVPLVADTLAGQMIFMFRRFSFAAVNRILIPAAQRLRAGDLETINAILLYTAMGTMSYAIKATISGKDIDWSNVGGLVAEGIDRSGLIGIFGDANLILERLTRGHLGISPLLGDSDPLGRGVSRRMGESVFGPVVGLPEDIALVIGGVSAAIDEGDADHIKLRDIKRLIPYSNLFYIRALLATVAEAQESEQGILEELRQN